MSYIGKTPTVGNFIKLDALTASATASYTMQHGGVNFQPESALHMLVSLNGVIQSPNTSFTISGSTITFSSALTSSDSIDFIIVYGNVLDIGTPSDGTVTDAKANFVSTSSAAGLQIKGDGTTDGTLQLNCSQNSHGVKIKSPAHSAGQSYTLTLPTTSPSAGKVLQTDGSGNLSFASAGGGKIGQVVQTILTSTTSSSSSSYVDVGMDISITPSATSSKVLLMFHPRVGHDTATANVFMKVRNNTAGSDVTADPFIVKRWPNDSQAAYYTQPHPIVIMDSPNTSSAVQYKMQFKTNAGGFRINQPANNGGYSDTEVSTVIAMEVLA